MTINPNDPTLAAQYGAGFNPAMSSQPGVYPGGLGSVYDRSTVAPSDPYAVPPPEGREPSQSDIDALPLAAVPTGTDDTNPFWHNLYDTAKDAIPTLNPGQTLGDLATAAKVATPLGLLVGDSKTTVPAGSTAPSTEAAKAASPRDRSATGPAQPANPLAGINGAWEQGTQANLSTRLGSIGEMEAAAQTERDLEVQRAKALNEQAVDRQRATAVYAERLKAKQEAFQAANTVAQDDYDRASLQAKYWNAKPEDNELIESMHQANKVLSDPNADPQTKEAAAREAKTAQSELDKHKAGEVDPNRYWHDKSNANKVLSAIAVALGAFGSTLTHTQNGAMDVINDAVDQDIKAQIGAKQTKEGAVGEARTRIGVLRQTFGDDLSAMGMEKAQRLEEVDSKAQTMASSLNTQAAQIGYQNLHAKLQAAKADVSQGVLDQTRAVRMSAAMAGQKDAPKLSEQSQGDVATIQRYTNTALKRLDDARRAYKSGYSVGQNSDEAKLAIGDAAAAYNMLVSHGREYARMDNSPEAVERRTHPFNFDPTGAWTQMKGAEKRFDEIEKLIRDAAKTQLEIYGIKAE